MMTHLKFIYSEKTTKFCKISNLLLTTGYIVESKVEILQNFVDFSEYMNFTYVIFTYCAGSMTHAQLDDHLSYPTGCLNNHLNDYFAWRI